MNSKIDKIKNEASKLKKKFTDKTEFLKKKTQDLLKTETSKFLKKKTKNFLESKNQQYLKPNEPLQMSLNRNDLKNRPLRMTENNPVTEQRITGLDQELDNTHLTNLLLQDPIHILDDQILKDNIKTLFIYIIIIIIFMLILFFIILLLFFIIILPLHIFFNKLSDNSWNNISNVPLFKLYKYHFINYLFHNTNNINFSYIFYNDLFYYNSFNILLILSFFLLLLLFISFIYYSLSLVLSIPLDQKFHDNLPDNFTLFKIVLYITIITIILWYINNIAFNTIIYNKINKIYIKSQDFDVLVNEYFIKNDNITKNILNSSISDKLSKYIKQNYNQNIFINYYDNKIEVQKIIFTFFLSKYIQHTYIEVHDTSNYNFNIDNKIKNYLKDPINSQDTFIGFLCDNIKFNEFVYNNFKTIHDIIPPDFITDDNNNNINWNIIQQDFETDFNFSYDDYNFDITYSTVMFFISLIISIITIIFIINYINN